MKKRDDMYFIIPDISLDFENETDGERIKYLEKRVSLLEREIKTKDIKIKDLEKINTDLQEAIKDDTFSMEEGDKE